MTQQPQWKRVANLGDVNPLDYGGFFVYIDETGVYAPEAELLEVPDDDGGDEDGTGEYRVYRFILEPCTFINGVLSDNSYHPELSAWFAKPEAERATRPQDSTYLSNVADLIGQDMNDLIADFCSEDPVRRAFAWRAVGEYHGFENLDHYPSTLTRAEAEARYPEYV